MDKGLITKYKTKEHKEAVKVVSEHIGGGWYEVRCGTKLIGKMRKSEAEEYLSKHE
jgi:translation initiation factor IF-1